MVIVLTFSFIGCQKGLTIKETMTVWKGWDKRTDELEKAKAKGIFSKAYIKSMDARITSLGGVFAIESVYPTGTRVSGRTPVETALFIHVPSIEMNRREKSSNSRYRPMCQAFDNKRP